jgi:hypothetical protein
MSILRIDSEKAKSKWQKVRLWNPLTLCSALKANCAIIILFADLRQVSTHFVQLAHGFIHFPQHKVRFEDGLVSLRTEVRIRKWRKDAGKRCRPSATSQEERRYLDADFAEANRRLAVTADFGNWLLTLVRKPI